MCAVQKQLPGDLKPLSALFQQLLTEAGYWVTAWHILDKILAVSPSMQEEDMQPPLGLSKCEPWRFIACL